MSAFIPRRDESKADTLGSDTAAWMQATTDVLLDGTIPIDFATFSTVLMQDEPADLQRLVFDQLTPQPGGYVLDSSDADGLESLGVPITYLLAGRGIALAAPGVDLAARVGGEPIMVRGTHEAMLTHPDELAKALLENMRNL